MARLTILTPKELHELYGLQQFTDEERDVYFGLDPREKQAVDEFRTYTAKTYFILQLGYFKAKKQFFVFDLQTTADEVQYILRRHFPQVTSLSDLTVSKPTRLAQQAEILRLFDYQMCSQEWKMKLQEKAGELAVIYTKPVYIFKELANFLEHHRVVLPGYSFLQEKIIGRAITGEQNRLENAVQTGVPEEQRIKLDNLLTAEESLYQLTLLKREPKDFSHQEVQKEVAKRTQLTELYQLATRFLPDLHISNENIKYYASLVSYYPVKDIKKTSREIAHAYLLCFISYRYQMVNDNLVNTFLYHVNKFIEDAKEAAKEQMAKEKFEANQHLRDAGKILNLFTDETIPNETNFGTIKQKAFAFLEKEKFSLVSQYLTKAVLDETAYEWQQYVRFSAKFKLNLRHLFMVIPFENQTKDEPLLKAVAFLQEAFANNKSLRDYSQKSFPKTCIPEKWKKYLYEIKTIPWYGKRKNRRMLNADKYEFLIYKLLKQGLDAGDIFIRDSRNFKSFEEDWISDEQWKQKDALINNLNLPYLHEPMETILARKKVELETLIKRVNDRIANGENPDIKVTGSEDNVRWHLPYRSDVEPLDHPLYAKLPHISIADIVYFVNQKTGCFSSFTHLVDRYAKTESNTKRIAGSLVAFGENIGLFKMASISDVSLQDLLTTAHNFIRLETLKPGNDIITNAMAKLPVFRYMNIEEEIIHGSIDGQKIDTQIDTINSRHSPKYFVLGKGVSAITLVANHIPVNARIIGTHEHESHFAFDLVYNNTSDVDPHIVSTDTHGTNQVNHAILDFFGYQFAPRYKHLDSEHRTIYGFHHPQYYQGMIVKPGRKIKEHLILAEEDNIKRIIVSLALKSTTQSTIIRKLSSYDRKNRTKKALWEYDNIILSIYLLNYIDSLLVRQSVQKALNRGEAYHRLKRAVFHENEGKFRVKTELEQNIWNDCARFLTNCIIFYNAYILSALLTQAEKAGKTEEAKIIKRISPIAWRHVNFLGRFVFQRQQKPLDIDEMIKALESEIKWQKQELTDEVLT
jgi:TnpA family transposase